MKDHSRRAKFLGKCLMIASVAFIMIGFPVQIWKMYSAWSVEGFSIIPMYINIGIQCMAYFYGRDIGNRVIWIPATASFTLGLVIVALYHVISQFPSGIELS